MFEEKGIDKDQYCVRNVKLELNFLFIYIYILDYKLIHLK